MLGSSLSALTPAGLVYWRLGPLRLAPLPRHSTQRSLLTQRRERSGKLARSPLNFASAASRSSASSDPAVDCVQPLRLLLRRLAPRAPAHHVVDEALFLRAQPAVGLVLDLARHLVEGRTIDVVEATIGGRGVLAVDGMLRRRSAASQPVTACGPTRSASSWISVPSASSVRRIARAAATTSPSFGDDSSLISF